MNLYDLNQTIQNGDIHTISFDDLIVYQKQIMSEIHNQLELLQDNSCSKCTDITKLNIENCYKLNGQLQTEFLKQIEKL